jgi:type VI secretion system secreted protein Hcp
MANQFNIFMAVDSIPGEATATGYTNQIALSSCSFSGHNPIQISSSTGGLSAGVPTLSSVNVTTETTSASPLILKALVTGQHIDTVTITFLKTGGANPDKYLTLALSDCFIESASTGAAGNDVATESWSIAYASLTHTYYGQDDTGKLSQKAQMTYSVQSQSSS